MNALSCCCYASLQLLIIISWLKRFRQWVAVSANALDRFSFSFRSVFLSVAFSMFETAFLACGASLHTLFLLYMIPLVHKFSVTYDILMTFSLNQETHCLITMSDWMFTNFLQLNTENTGILNIAPDYLSPIGEWWIRYLSTNTVLS